jgi:hypothetical protein
MTLATLLLWCAKLVPEAADSSVIPDSSTTELSKTNILNEGAKEFVRITKCFPKEVRFNCVADDQEVYISDVATDFMEMREEGIWHYRSDTSSTTWERLEPTTIRELDMKFPSWRVQSSSDYVKQYYQEGNTIGFHYTPSTTITNGFRMYYYGNSTDMTGNTHYPFTGSTTQDPRLSNYERIILEYYKSVALGILHYNDDSANALKNFYYLCEEAKRDLQGRRDLAQQGRIKIKSPLVGSRR